MISLFRSTAFAVTILSLLQVVCARHLPVVDLGYELQRASSYNHTGQFYNFSNIRYAAPPVGNLRFSAPQPPKKNRAHVQTGAGERICPQALPNWEGVVTKFLTQYEKGRTKFNHHDLNISASTVPYQQPAGVTEDCLFLDVFVPKAIFENAGKGKGAPVLVWIYGGGYVEGYKSGSGNPAGLLLRSESNDAKGVIYVALNYRLGAFGWLSGPTFQESGTPNAGLYDQRFALEWVQKHISKFGGDPSRVTVFGESAGGGSIMHQITAYGGQKPVPFQQAIPQSPGFLPLVSNHQNEQIFNEFLKYAGVSTLDEARQLPYHKVLEANTQQISNAKYGQYVYGPAVDGDFVPALPGVLLLHGQYAKDLNVMVGHNADEGLLFTNPFIQTEAEFKNHIRTAFPTTKAYPSVVNYIANVLYPPVFDGSQAMNYTNQIAREAALTSESIFTCNTFYLDKAYGNKTYSYYFTVPPALHGEDVAYTYYNGPSSDVISKEVALAMQKYITHFAEHGTPNEPGVPYFPIYGKNAQVQDLNVTGISQVMDPTANYRCDWWQKALYQ